MNIRQATIEDIDELYMLGEQTPEFSVNADTVTFWPKDTLASAIAATDVIVLVCHDEHEIQGFIIASYSEGLRKATIENVWVAPGYRKKGIGKDLLSELVEHLTEQGCEYIATLIPPDANEALYLYLNAGFTKGQTFLWLDKSISNNFKS